MGRGEKALVQLLDRPLISYVLTAVTEAGLEPVVITSPHTPYTTNYCRAHGIDWVCSRGIGYIEDLIESVTCMDITDPFFTLCVDIPGLKAEHIRTILTRYTTSDKDALSVWIPLPPNPESGMGSLIPSEINGIAVLPAGINILSGNMINEEQSEDQMLIADHALTFNLNTQQDLLRAESFFRTIFSTPSAQY